MSELLLADVVRYFWPYFADEVASLLRRSEVVLTENHPHHDLVVLLSEMTRSEERIQTEDHKVLMVGSSHSFVQVDRSPVLSNLKPRNHHV